METSEAFYLAIVPLLKSKATKAFHNSQFAMRHDVYRYLFHNRGTQARDGKHFMFNLKDFDRLNLPPYWWYVLDPDWKVCKLRSQDRNFPDILRAQFSNLRAWYLNLRVMVFTLKIVMLKLNNVK